MNYMGKATAVWQLTLSNRCHQNVTQKTQDTRHSSVLPEQLQTLLGKSSEHLNRTQKRHRRSYLTNYQDVSALTDDDMGYTDIVRHEIKTNGSNIKWLI